MSNSSLVDRQLYYTTPEEEAEWEMLVDRWRGSVLFGVGCYEEALTAYEHALQLDPKNTAAWKGKADTLACLGRLGKAHIAYKRARELDPTMEIGKTELLCGTAP